MSKLRHFKTGICSQKLLATFKIHYKKTQQVTLKELCDFEIVKFKLYFLVKRPPVIFKK